MTWFHLRKCMQLHLHIPEEPKQPSQCQPEPHVSTKGSTRKVININRRPAIETQKS